jgi:tripartite-type tricarboxylate transporter receptor subunit TctC
MAAMGTIPRNTWLLCVTVFAVLTAATAMAADDYLAKPGRLILSSGAGAGPSTDIMGLIFSQRFSDAGGKPRWSITAQVPPADFIATEIAARAAPDGYTLFIYGIGQSVAPARDKNLSYNGLRDFTPISTYAMTANLLTVTPTLRIAHVQKSCPNSSNSFARTAQLRCR